MKLHIKFTKEDIERLILKEIETEYPDQFHEAKLSWEYWRIPHVLDGREAVFVHDFEVDVSPIERIPHRPAREMFEDPEERMRWKEYVKRKSDA